MLRTFLTFAFLLSFSASFSQIALKKVYVDKQIRPVPKNLTIHLISSENDLILEFQEEQNDSSEYSYRLKGEDNDSTWVTSAYPVAHFENISDGKYVFQIKKTDTAPTNIKIEKEITFWNEWYFIPVVVVYFMILVGVGIYFMFLYDFRQKLKIQGVRNQIAADLHDEVGSNLNSIAIFVEVLRSKATPDILPILDKIIENSKESISLMQDTIWTINPKNDGVEKLFERMRSFAAQYLSNAAISLNFEVDTDLKKVNLTMEQRKNIYLIFKEAINNVVKHAQATTVNVKIKKQYEVLKISIIDNGKGFDTEHEFEGNGLQNFKTRAEEAEMECILQSKPNDGTSVEIKVY